MANEEDKEEQQELMPIAEYEIIEQRDDQAIVEMMTGQAIQDYVYSFRKGSQVVEGLTLAGINEAANRRGGIQVEEVEYEERDNSWIVIAKATDTITGSSRYGAFEQSKKVGNRPDPFAFTKAVHKAQRNAIKQLLPVPVIKEVLNYYLHRQNRTSSQETSSPKKKKNDKISNAQKAAFATAHKLRDQLEKSGISQKSFWTYVKRRYAVESRNDMTEMQWTQLAAELNASERDEKIFNQLVERVNKIISAMQEGEVNQDDETETETENETESENEESTENTETKSENKKSKGSSLEQSTSEKLPF